MKILHVIAGLAPRYGGPSKACREMARAVARLGHEVAIYTTNADGDGVLPVPTDRPVEEDGVTLRYFPVQSPRFWKPSRPLAQA
ncbi:MAG: glycosyl transferase group 1, partial [Proteobacteria bacterium]|nr:glycosyl transferase group 1 [Pseudomonadota bacterium]